MEEEIDRQSMFDPYHKWLGISKKHRPPTYYQLLGIDSDEDDLEVIEEAAMMRTAHLRSFQSGPQAEHCANLLTEIAEAAETLRDSEKRRAYDAKHAAHVAAPQDSAPEPPIIVTSPDEPVSKSRRRSRRKTNRQRRNRNAIVWAAVGLVCVVIAVGVFKRGDENDRRDERVANSSETEEKSKSGEVKRRGSATATGNGTQSSKSAAAPRKTDNSRTTTAKQTTFQLEPVCAAVTAGRAIVEPISEAIAFTAPRGDGRGGANGVLVQASADWLQHGTEWKFEYERKGAAWGVQVIHPWKDGHILVGIHPSVQVMAGGPWTAIGWHLRGPAIEISQGAAYGEFLPVANSKPHVISSRLDSDGQYRLTLDDRVVAEATVTECRPLSLEIPEGKIPPGAASWAKPKFTGATLPRKLRTGEAALLIGPTDRDINQARSVRFGPGVALPSKSQSVTSTQLKKGLIVHLPLDEITDGRVRDVAAECDRPIEGHASRANGIIGGSVFLGRQASINLGDAADFDRDDAFSYGAWVYRAVPGDMAILGRMKDDLTFRGFELVIVGGQVSAHLISRWENDAMNVRMYRQLEMRRWFHVMMTYDGSASVSGMKIFVDGEVQQVRTISDRLASSIKFDGPLVIGKRGNRQDMKFVGTLDDLRIYDRELSEAEVGALAIQPEVQQPDAVRDVVMRQVPDAQQVSVVSLDGRNLLTATKNRSTMTLMELETGKVIHEFQETDPGYGCGAFSQNARLAAAAGKGRKIRVWSVADGTLINELEGHEKGITSLCFSSDGTRLYSGSHDRTIRSWNVGTGQEIHRLTGHPREIASIAVSEAAGLLISGGFGQLRLWNLKTGKSIWSKRLGTYAVAISLDGQLAASGHVDKIVRLWKVETGEELRQLPAGSHVYRLAFSEDQSTLLSGGYDAVVRIWDVSSGTCNLTLVGHRNLISDLTFLSRRQQIISASPNEVWHWQYNGSGPASN